MRYAAQTTALIALLILAAGTGCYEQYTATVTLNADGTVVVNTDMLIPRDEVEERIAAFAAMAAVEDEDDEDTSGEEDAPGDKEAPDDESAEFAARIRKAFAAYAEMATPPGVTWEIKSIDVREDTVRIVTAKRYATLEAFAADFRRIIGWFGHRGILIDTDENDKLRLTMRPTDWLGEGYEDAVDQLRGDVEDSKLKATIAFVLPGTIISSSLPHTDANKTYVEVDATSAESLEAAAKFFREKQVIVAEPGKLDLTQLPLGLASEDEENAAKHEDDTDDGEGAAQPDEGDDGQIPAAGEGFIVEALGVTTTTVHAFPEARGQYKQYADSFVSDESNECLIRARLYAPEGRTIRELGAVRVTRAVDDQGRSIKPKRSPRRRTVPSRYVYDRDDQSGGQTDLMLRLELPASGAITIEELDGEAIITTFGKWREHRIDNIRADKDNEIDISDVLEGGAVTIRTVALRVDDDGDLSGTVSLKATGPEDLQNVEFLVEAPEAENLRSYEVRSSATSRGGKCTRSISMQLYSYGGEFDKSQQVALTLVVRRPDDVKRERVKFTLETVDLF